MKKLIPLLLILLILIGIAACRNPIRDAVTGGESALPDTPEKTEQPAPDLSDDLANAIIADPGDDDALREQLTALLEEKLGTSDPGTGDKYGYVLGDRVADSAGREYFYGRWVYYIFDLDSNSEVTSLLSEFFITPDGTECFIGYYFPENAGNGDTVVLSTGNIFDPVAGFVQE